jgi:hypothetical protein
MRLLPHADHEYNEFHFDAASENGLSETRRCKQ